MVKWNQGVISEDPGRSGASDHRNHPFRLGHLLIQPADHRCHLVRNAPRDNHQIRLPGRTAHHFSAEARDVKSRPNHGHHFDRATCQPKRHRPNGILAAPVDGFVERGGDNAFRTVYIVLVVNTCEKARRKTRLKLNIAVHDPIITWTRSKTIRRPGVPNSLSWLRPPKLGALKPNIGMFGASSIMPPRKSRKQFSNRCEWH